MRARVFALSVLLLLAGCGGHSAPSAKPTPAPRSSVLPTVRDTATLEVSAHGSSVSCLERIVVDELGYWENTLTASSPMTITDVRTVGHGVRVLGGLLVPVNGGTVHSAGITDWPPTADRTLRRDVDWSRRTQLVGAKVPVQRAMLPMLHLRASGGGRLDAVVFGFRSDDGQVGTARLTLGIRFSRTTC
ncbi:MAG: hypothetical protein ACJ716_16245 [Marmoricola sp.]